MKILLFGGTTEGRQLAERLAQLDVELTVSVATELGAEQLADIAGIDVICGRKNMQEIEKLLSGYTMCVDATHPYAVEVSRNIADACATAGVPLHRLLRCESQTDGVITVDSCAAAASYLADRQGKVLLTTGSKELFAFAELGADRLYARVLPTHDSIAACEAAGLSHSNILALQGPFSREMNEAMLHQYDIAWLVTKDGGSAGGFPEKLAAAQSAGVGVVLVGRPAEHGETLEEICNLIREAMQWL